MIIINEIVYEFLRLFNKGNNFMAHQTRFLVKILYLLKWAFILQEDPPLIFSLIAV